MTNNRYGVKNLKPKSQGQSQEQENYTITGRIRDEDNRAVEGFHIQAFDKDISLYFHPDDRLGRSTTDESGSFEITFNKEAFEDWFEGNPEVYLVIRERDGKKIITMESKENTTKDMEFQIKLDTIELNPDEPDIYAGNFERMLAAVSNGMGTEDLSKTDVTIIFEIFVRILKSWTIYRNELVSYCGYDGVQVPRQPRREEHEHIVRWDRPVLPI